MLLFEFLFTCHPPTLNVQNMNTNIKHNSSENGDRKSKVPAKYYVHNNCARGYASE